jgi:predicted RNA-binding protein with PIN domain
VDTDSGRWFKRFGGGRLWMRHDAARTMRAMQWWVDGYNVIRRDPALASREGISLEAGRATLCARLAEVARASGERFTVVFDGAGAGSAAAGGTVRVIFSSARESADRVLARLAARGGAVVSNDREVRRAAERAGAIAVSTDLFLARLDTLIGSPSPPSDPYMKDADAEPEARPRPRKGNARRLPRKGRAAERALGRLGKPRG